MDDNQRFRVSVLLRFGVLAFLRFALVTELDFWNPPAGMLVNCTSSIVGSNILVGSPPTPIHTNPIFFVKWNCSFPRSIDFHCLQGWIPIHT